MVRFAWILLILLVPHQSWANDETLFKNSGQPIPRFVSIKSDTVNVRVGPGKRYPVKWIYKRKNLPVEVIEEFGHWRKVRDFENEEGWIHKGLLSGARYAFIRTQQRSLYLAPDANSPVVMEADAMVIGHIQECNTQWCKLEIAGQDGWIRRVYLWGIYDNERITDD